MLENFLAKTIFFIRPKEFFFHGHEDQKCQGVERWWSWNSLMCILPAYFTNFDIGCCLHTIFWRIHVKIHLNVLTFHFNFILPGVWKYSPIFPQPNSYPNMWKLKDWPEIMTVWTEICHGLHWTFLKNSSVPSRLTMGIVFIKVKLISRVISVGEDNLLLRSAKVNILSKTDWARFF